MVGYAYWTNWAYGMAGGLTGPEAWVGGPQAGPQTWLDGPEGGGTDRQTE